MMWPARELTIYPWRVLAQDACESHCYPIRHQRDQESPAEAADERVGSPPPAPCRGSLGRAAITPAAEVFAGTCGWDQEP